MWRSAMLLAVGSLALALPARASVYDISYAGTGDFGGAGVATATGSGSFAVAGDPAEITLAAITAFSFTLSLPGAAPVSYGLADLPAFTAVAPHGTLVALLPPTGAGQWTETLTASPASYVNDGWDSGGAVMTVAAVTPSIVYDAPAAVPEPATLAVFGAGLAGLGWLRRRRRAGRLPRVGIARA